MIHNNDDDDNDNNNNKNNKNVGHNEYDYLHTHTQRTQYVHTPVVRMPSPISPASPVARQAGGMWVVHLLMVDEAALCLLYCFHVACV